MCSIETVPSAPSTETALRRRYPVLENEEFHTLTQLVQASCASSAAAEQSYYEEDSGGESGAQMNKGAKIGMGVGIVVVVVLTVIAIGFCLLDCRRKLKKRQSARHSGEEEVAIWEDQLQRARSGPPKNEGAGLWDKLKDKSSLPKIHDDLGDTPSKGHCNDKQIDGAVDEKSRHSEYN
ncbi:hypothetical protein BU24DRAFT_429297 [Aaosphaeria arxii CBS 175.79]|uniref:Uncharacterized protein n=1 Tax=Aaosphaeria arxii CBS 175.79 TaxID=1450172 RepID=A0A6A5X662_9PLEO|nr:uncharacterized protein BU24DRAFT_429297 [Aaosphaeria arxii CBS 175.79]KAF2008439.1 hypothetical protein BU24DRAFT_429297 [Aaosphaeria arxii CBS 175.79]